MFGASAEIITSVVERLGRLRSRPRRVAWPQSAIPTSSKLEDEFYPGKQDIVQACRGCVADDEVSQGLE